MNIKILNCTKEIYNVLNFAKYLALKNNSRDINLDYLLISLILNSKLVQIALNLSKDKLNILKLTYIKNINISNKNIKLNSEVLQILICLNNKVDIISTLNLFNYILKLKPQYFNFLKYNLNIKNLNNFINTELNSNQINILPEYNTILNNLNSENIYNKIIFGREEEISFIKEILNKKYNNNIYLIGDEGIGKQSIVIKLIQSLNKDKYNFLKLNLNNLIKVASDNKYLNKILDYLIKIPNLILIIEDFYLLFDKTNLDIVYLKNKIFILLKNNNIRIITYSNKNIFDKIISDNEELKFYFSFEYIKELTNDYLLKILKYKLKFFNSYYNININNINLINIIKYSNLYIKNIPSPKKDLLIIDSLYSKYTNCNRIKTTNINIDSEDIFNIISKISNLPLELLNRTSNTSLIIEKLNKYLFNKIFGQDLALTKIITSLKRAFTGLKDKNKPIGSWLLCGPSGTGKTELVKSLAHVLFGSEVEMIRFDMSEFMEKHSISKLIGPPPGYIGFESGGLLTEAVKKKPYTVILFDEIEKAHKDINNIMLQLLDEGFLTDSSGNKINFSNTLIIFTSNLGCPTDPNEFESFKKGIEVNKNEYKLLSRKVHTAVKKFFKPEFLNRLDDIIVFKPLSINYLINIIDKFINIIITKLENNNIFLKIDLTKEIKLLLAKLAYHPLYGARPLKRLINQFIEKPITDIILNYNINNSSILSIFIDPKTNKINYLLKNIS